MVYFVSDIHLGAGDRAEVASVERRFFAWLDSVADDAEAIFLCGDVFDFWFEYSHLVPKGFVRTLGKIAELTDRGVRVVYVAGNHDMWMGGYLADECGVEIYLKPAIFELCGKRVHVAHGDNMNVRRDWKLKAVNAMFRSSVVRWAFKWLIHPDLAMSFGQWWSGASRKRHRKLDGHGTIEGYGVRPLVEYAEGVQAGLAEGERCDYFVYGHLHQSLCHDIDGAQVVFLGDWSEEPTTAVLGKDGVMKIEKIK